MSHTISQSRIQELQNDVLKVLDKVEKSKYQIRTHDHRQLVNHLQYTLTTLRNMSNTIAVEKSDPYNSYQSDYQAGPHAGKKVQYAPDGKAHIIGASDVHTTGDGWEAQFDENLLIKPPCFQMPPQNLTSIPVIRRTSEFHRVANLG